MNCPIEFMSDVVVVTTDKKSFERLKLSKKQRQLSSSCQVLCGVWRCVVYIVLYGNLIFNLDDSRFVIYEFKR